MDTSTNAFELSPCVSVLSGDLCEQPVVSAPKGTWTAKVHYIAVCSHHWFMALYNPWTARKSHPLGHAAT